MSQMKKSISSARQRVGTYQKNLIYVLQIEGEKLKELQESNELAEIDKLILADLISDIENVVKMNQKETL